jgi:hypothetical protein
MPENSEIPAAALPPSTPLPDVTQTATPDTGGNSIGEKIRAATAATLQKFNVIRRGRGRPKLDGSPKKSDVVAPDAAPGARAFPVDFVATGDSVAAVAATPGHQLLRRCVAKLAASEISFLTSIVEIKADAAGVDEVFLKEALAAASPAPKAFEDVGESADLVAIKYGWNVDKLPEIALGADLLALHLPFAKLFFALNSEIKRKRAAEKPASAPQPEAEK